MNIDITTLAMAIGIINILQVGALFSQWQFDKNHFPGQGWWLLGTGSMALGFVAMFLRAIPPLASICVFGNYVFFVCALTFQYIGILRFFGQRERRGPIIAFLAICILVAIYLTFINNDIVLRRIALYLTVAALGFLTTRAIFRHKTRFVNTSANLLAAVFLTQGIALTAATLLLITGPPPATSTATSTEQIVAMLNALITTSLWTIGFIFMVNQRLGAANSEATENRELIFNTAPDAILVARLNGGIIVEINDGFTMLTGYTRAEVIGKSTTAVNIWKNPEDRKLVLTALHEKGYFENLEAVFQCKDGSQLAGLMSARIINLQGEPHIVSVTRNITGRKLAEANLRISEERYRLLAENANDVIWTMSLDGRITYVSPSVERMRGFTPGEAMNQPLDEILTPDSAASSLRYWKELAARLQAGLPPQRFHGEYEYYCKDGSTVWTDVQVIPYVVGVNSQPAEILGVTRDIGERKQAEEYREMRQEILAILNEPEDSPDAMQRVLAVLKARTRCSAVAIRLQEGADFPYFAQDGFPADFLRTENTLISRDADGLMCRDKDGNVRLECTCGLVMEGRTDPANSLFTRGGSFWTSDSFPLLDLPCDQEPRYRPRNQCTHHGYASFALVPLRNKERIVGLIQFNDPRKGYFTLATVEHLEKIAAHIGAALVRRWAEEALQEAHDHLELRVEERTRELHESLLQAEDLTVQTEELAVRAQELALQAEATSRAKSLFIGNMHHELRTPLSGVLGMTEALLNTPVTDQQRGYAETIRKSGKALLAVVGDILDFSKISSGKMALEIAPFLVESVIVSVVNLFGPAAAEEKIGLHTIIDPELPAVRGDAQRLTQVVSHLVGNAVKFTKKGEIRVSVKILRRTEAEIDLAIGVQDTGIGMTEEELSRVFAGFTQGDTTTGRRFGGTGLGLTIGQNLVELMGGKIQVESVFGKGSLLTVLLTFPIAQGFAKSDFKSVPINPVAPTTPARPKLPPGDMAELQTLLEQLKEPLDNGEPMPCKKIMATLLQKSWPEEQEILLAELDRLVKRYRLQEAFDLLNKKTGTED